MTQTNSKKILFDQIHTQDKQLRLQEQMSIVGEYIRNNFPKQPKINNCPCCKSKDIGFFAEKYGFNLDTCRQCGHIFTNPFPSEESLNYFYNSDFKNFENKFFIESFEQRVPIFSARIQELIKNKVGKKILDVGAAIGLFCEANARAGEPFDITACDLSLSACESLKLRFPKTAVICSDVALLIGQSQYDCVTSWDTIEHITNPEQFLDAIFKLLVPKGFFCFSTPNTYSYEWYAMGEDHIQLLPPGHVNLYNAENISGLLNRMGFNLLSIDTLNPSLDISYIDKFVLNRNDPKQTPAEQSGKIFHKLMMEDSLFHEQVCNAFKKRKMGGNMLVVAQKAS